MKSVPPKSLSDLSVKEVWLIVALRERWRFGDVIIVMRDGVPQRIKRAWESEDPPEGSE